MNKQAKTSAKLEELQPIAKADTVAAHLLLLNRTPKTSNAFKNKN